jgi:hypothetical protein
LIVYVTEMEDRAQYIMISCMYNFLQWSGFIFTTFCVSYWIRESGQNQMNSKKGTNKATNTMVNEYEFHNEVIIIII